MGMKEVKSWNIERLPTGIVIVAQLKMLLRNRRTHLSWFVPFSHYTLTRNLFFLLKTDYLSKTKQWKKLLIKLQWSKGLVTLCIFLGNVSRNA